MSTNTSYDVWVCTDCYFAHHYGATEHEGQWYAGEFDTPADREPLSLLPGDRYIADNTCSNHRYGQDDETNDNGEYVTPCDCCHSADDENGIREFSWSSCEGCGSTLGGSRYRLAVFES